MRTSAWNRRRSSSARPAGRFSAPWGACGRGRRYRTAAMRRTGTRADQSPPPPPTKAPRGRGPLWSSGSGSTRSCSTAASPEPRSAPRLGGLMEGGRCWRSSQELPNLLDPLLLEDAPSEEEVLPCCRGGSAEDSFLDCFPGFPRKHNLKHCSTAADLPAGERRRPSRPRRRPRPSRRFAPSRPRCPPAAPAHPSSHQLPCGGRGD
mmetsp:Transcript_22922/g.57945  ORF Transcript_22922/g.57945 Transcript_22922/m.57945 type:complete len:206 (+) Transcript_22922:481-1098(+)